MFRGWNATEVVLLWLAAIVIGFAIGIIIGVASAKAHIMKLKPGTDGQKIIQLQKRIAHDKHEIGGEWIPIGRGWLAQSINRIDAHTHKRDLRVVIMVYQRYWAKLGDVRDWICIYGHENAGYGWAANTGNSYYGGLQMDRQFQRTYGSWLYTHIGTADKWNRYDQIIIAEKARRSGRGYYPWPNTARTCGLI